MLGMPEFRLRQLFDGIGIPSSRNSNFDGIGITPFGRDRWFRHPIEFRQLNGTR